MVDPALARGRVAPPAVEARAHAPRHGLDDRLVLGLYAVQPRARALLEPRAAVLALPHVTRDILRDLKRVDDAIDASLVTGDVEAYMRLNHLFHFTIYRQSRSDVFLPLIESVRALVAKYEKA